MWSALWRAACVSLYLASVRPSSPCGAQGRREFGDVDTYDFKLQCSGVWQVRVRVRVRVRVIQAAVLGRVAGEG